ncbi:MAG: MBL fold metallo-hydrolase [Hydrogenophaga sp.]|nr:MBL fold metallo-hydrolase [Hydrogenophaga sp.]
MLQPSSTARLQRCGITIFERGWLSSNNILITGIEGPAALVDAGYCIHAEQTLALVSTALTERPLDLLLNTHLHSDHCGGNAALQARYPGVQTRIPPGLAQAVMDWDTVALTYAPTGQECPRFVFDDLLRPGDRLILGDWKWEVHGAKGHDPHAIILYQPDNGVLLSADALWQNGFGVVFPELEGASAFDEVGETLDLIAELRPAVVVPGHGPAFDDVTEALQRARSRLQRFVASPDQHLRHAQKVLIKFRLLAWQRIERSELLQWAMSTPYLRQAMPQGSEASCSKWLENLLQDLERSKALRLDGDLVINM